MKIIPALLAILAFIPLLNGAPRDAREVNPVEVGASLPDAKVGLLDGSTSTLAAITKGKPSILVFYRGSWCPYCNRHLSELMDVEETLKELGFQIIGLSPDKAEFLAEAVDKNDLGYELVSDSQAEAAKALGVAFVLDAKTRELYKGYGIDLEVASGENHHMLPVPAVFVTDKKGRITYRYFNPDYKERLSAKDLLAAVR